VIEELNLVLARRPSQLRRGRGFVVGSCGNGGPSAGRVEKSSEGPNGMRKNGVVKIMRNGNVR